MPTERQLDQQLHERLRAENLERSECGGAAPPVYVSPDPYATLRAAFRAGATIQAYTVEGDDGQAPLSAVQDFGYWRDLSCDGEPKFSCHPTRYRVNPEGA